MLRLVSISVAIISLFSTIVYAEKEDADTKVERLKDAETKDYSTEFWKQYDKLGVRKQVCLAYGMKEAADNPKKEISVSMHGPHFYRSANTGQIFGLLTIGAVGQFRVEFEAATQSKSHFVECWSGQGRSFGTFEECYSFVSGEMNKLFKFDADGKAIKPAEQAGAGQPATRSESKSEDSQKPQPESEGRSR